MKIVCLYHLGFKLFPRGYKQVEALSEVGHDVLILCTERGNRLQNKENESITLEKENESITIERTQILWPDRTLLKPFAILYVISLLFRSLLSHRDADAIHCFGIYSLVPGVLFKLFTDVRLSYDASEDYVYQIERSGIVGGLSSYFSPAFFRFELLLVSYCDYVFTVPSVDNRLEKRFGRVDTSIVTLQNVPRRSEGNLPTPSDCNLYDPDLITLIYVGGLSREKGALDMAEAITEAAEDSNETIQAFIIGPFNDDSQTDVEQHIASADTDVKIHLIGFVPYDEVLPYLAASDIALHLYRDTPWNRRSTGSSKLYRYMAAELPIVASNLPGIGGVVVENDCGIVVEPSNPEAAANAIIDLTVSPERRQELGANGRSAFENGYNWDLEREKLLEAFNNG